MNDTFSLKPIIHIPNILNDNIGYVELYDFSDSINNKETMINYLGWVAGTCYGNNNVNNPQKIYDRLLHESVHGAARPFEFIPVYSDFYYDYIFQIKEDFNSYLKYCYLHNENHQSILLTNLRNYIKHNSIESLFQFKTQTNIDLSNFIVFKLKLPMFVRDQFMTHTQVSKLNKSNRVGKESDEYYIPIGFMDKLLNEYNVYPPLRTEIESMNTNDIFTYYVSKKTLKNFGFKKEIITRYPNQLKYGDMLIAGWIQDKNGIYNMLLERNGLEDVYRNWTQLETGLYAKAMANILKEINKI